MTRELKDHGYFHEALANSATSATLAADSISLPNHLQPHISVATDGRASSCLFGDNAELPRIYNEVSNLDVAPNVYEYDVRQSEPLPQTTLCLHTAGRLRRPSVSLHEDNKQYYGTSGKGLPPLPEQDDLTRVAHIVAREQEGPTLSEHAEDTLKTKVTSSSDGLNIHCKSPRADAVIPDEDISILVLDPYATPKRCSDTTQEAIKTESSLAHRMQGQPESKLSTTSHEIASPMPRRGLGQSSHSNDARSSSLENIKSNETRGTTCPQGELEKLKTANSKLKTRVARYKQAYEKALAARNEARSSLVSLKERFDAMERLFLDSAKDESSARRELRLTQEQLDLAHQKIDTLLSHGHKRSLSDEYKDRLVRIAGEELAIRKWVV